MKKVIILAMLSLTTTAFAQDKKINLGIKAGLNYGDNGEIEFSDVTNAGENIATEDADDRVGYHIGAYIKANITDNIYLKPELLYTQNNSSYETSFGRSNYKVKRIDVPILAGITVLGPLHVFAGPSLQYIVDTELEDIDLEDVENEFTVGLQFGVGIQLGRLNADIRYERGLSENQAEGIQENTGATIRVDSRPNQFILSLGLDF